jgi:hypothetical protein
MDSSGLKLLGRAHKVQCFQRQNHPKNKIKNPIMEQINERQEGTTKS